MRADRAGLWTIPILVLFTVIPALSQAPPEGQAPPDDQTAPVPAPAQAPGPDGTQNGPGVARVSFIRGDVTMQRGDSGDFSSVTLNTPLMAGDKVATGDGSRSELQLDYASILRLDQHSEANIATLDNNRIQVQVGQGTTIFSVLNGAQADAEIDTPNVSVHPVRPGRYRVQVNSDGESVVTVSEGEAQISTSEGSTTVKKGQLIIVRGTGTEAQYKIGDAPGSDDFDNWNRDRDNTIYNAAANQKTNRYYTGAGDLDNYGTWSEVPDYGQVWIPQVDYGWAPYRAGRWLWEPYWGWTWASSEPWGWAPYHYGRWFLWGGAWAWWPGPIYPAYRPLWAPAYVSFFGFGRGGFGVGFGFGGFGFGSIGWLPIGPGDFFHPWWGGFRDHFGVVGFDRLGGLRDGIAPLHAGDRFSNLRNMTANDRLRQGVSGVSAESFGRGSAMPRSVAAADIAGGRMMTGNLPVVPTRDSLRASDRPVNSATTSRMSSQRSFFSKSAPAARSESFSSQAAHVNDAIARDGHFQAINGSRTSESGAGNRGSLAGSSSAAQGQARSIEGQRSQGSFQGQAAAGQSNGANGAFNRGNQGASDGWQRFSSSGSSSGANTSNGYASRSTSGRPTLDMSKPIVNERSYRGSGESYGGTNRSNSSPAYRSAPSSPSNRSYPSNQPSYRSAPSSSSRSSGSSSYGGSRGSSGSSRGSSGHSSGRSSGGHGR